jgi:ParB-like chromosome segregation protein Spo0J
MGNQVDRPDAEKWRLRIVGSGEEPPDQLLPNPLNWRTHHLEQQEALEGVLKEVGWVQQVVVNKRTRHLLDGHLRVSMARERGETKVPVLYVDLSPEEEAMVLATLDPLSSMATVDQDKLRELLEGIDAQEQAVREMLSRLAEEVGIAAPDVEFKEYDESIEGEVEYAECPNCGFKWPK